MLTTTSWPNCSTVRRRRERTQVTMPVPSTLQAGFHPHPRRLPQGACRGGGGGHIVGAASQQHIGRGLVRASGAQGATGCHGRCVSWHDVLLGDDGDIGPNLKKLKPLRQDDRPRMACACRNSRRGGVQPLCMRLQIQPHSCHRMSSDACIQVTGQRAEKSSDRPKLGPRPFRWR